MHTKFEVSSSSYSGDTKVVTDSTAESLTDRTTGINTGLNIASFTYIGRQRHKN